MASKKKHHYVPKFYLRNFATRLDLPPKERLQIHQLDVRNLSWRHDIGLKDQCQSAYLYGKTPELENLLSEFEGEFASIFRRLISGELTSFQDPHIEVYIRFFVILSLIRTPRQKEYADDSINNLVSKLLKMNFPDYKGGLRVSVNGFYHMAVSKLPRFALALDGTRPILVTSKTAKFITSDNPVVKHNQIFRMHNKERPCLGALAKGLQIFIPLSPQHMIVIFDEEAYKVKGDIVECTDRDVKLLNSLQVLNCSNSVYFSSRDDKRYIDLKYAYRKERNVGKSKFVELQHLTDPLRELVIQREEQHLPNVPLSFMKPKMQPYIDPRMMMSPTRRDPMIIESLANQLEREIEKRNNQTT